MGAVRVARTAGIRPKRMQVKAVSPVKNVRTNQSTLRLTNIGSLSVLGNVTRLGASSRASTAPLIAPSIESNTHSVETGTPAAHAMPPKPGEQLLLSGG